MNRQNAPPYIGSFNSRTIHRKNVAIKLDARTEQEALDDILRFAEENGRAPTYADFEKACVYGENYSSETICRHFDKTWNEILTGLGLEVNHNYTQKTEGEMVTDLALLYNQLGRPLSSSDLKIGLKRQLSLSESRSSDSTEEETIRLASRKTYLRKFGSFAEACKLAEVPCRDNLSDADMLKVIINYYKEFKKTPTAAAFKATNSYNGNSSAKSYENRFGSWDMAIKLALEHLERNQDGQ